jgi:predicted peptidase
MKKIFIFIFLLPGFLLISCNEDRIQKVVYYEYLSYLPQDYDKDENKHWPLIIFLHGASLRGTNLEKIKKYGIPKLISEGKEFEFVIISPQCPLYEDWSKDIWFPTLFEEIKKNFRIDTTRIYLTGLSMGGEGTWYISEQYPGSFAAIAPVCGRISELPSIEDDVELISQLPIWIFHGEKDRVYQVKESDEMYRLLKEINPRIKYTRYPDLGHGATHDTTYERPDLYEWFLSHKKK